MCLRIRMGWQKKLWLEKNGNGLEKKEKKEGMGGWGYQWGNTGTKWTWRLWEEGFVHLGKAESNEMRNNHTSRKIARKNGAENSILCTHSCPQSETEVKVSESQQILGRNHWPPVVVLWLVWLVLPTLYQQWLTEKVLCAQAVCYWCSAARAGKTGHHSHSTSQRLNIKPTFQFKTL